MVVSSRIRHVKSVMDRHFDSQACNLAGEILASLNTDFGNSVHQNLIDGSYISVVKARISPSAYNSADMFARDYLAQSLLSKADFLPTGLDLDSIAESKFRDAELNCAATNKRLNQRYVQQLYSPYTPESLFESARGKIASVLGPFSWDEAELDFGFGPGATCTLPHRFGDAYYKFRAKPCVTLSCAILAYTALIRVPRWFEHVASLTGRTPEDVVALSGHDRLTACFNIVKGNRVCFVPKDATKNRTIAIEPTMNGFIQHGIGSMIRRRLRKVGIDLNDQTLNQKLAYLGSLSGTLATLDLSAASDSVSLELCKTLLPTDWFEALCLCRSEYGTLPSGELIHYQKVSSMGNGFTFELESLIFWALCSAVKSAFRPKEHRVSVYGDDLIVPSEIVHPVVWLLNYSGFDLNMDKSFWDGPFRESCGKHYFHGTDVTPFYIRKDIDTPPRLIWLCNQIRRWSALSWGLDSTLLRVYEIARKQLPKSLQSPSIPDGYGDYALFGDWDEVHPRRCPNGVCGYEAVSWVPLFKSGTKSDIPFLLRQLAGAGSRITPREFFMAATLKQWQRIRGLQSDAFGLIESGAKLYWRKERFAVQNWKTLGPWL